MSNLIQIQNAAIRKRLLRAYWEEAQKYGKFVCPVCDSKMTNPPKDYNICCECMNEFGYDDANVSIKELRRRYREHKRL
jgi:ferredoxin-thioredoxin reductase catalytic subunit